MQALGIWEALQPEAAPIRRIHVLLSGSVKHCAPLGDGAEKMLALVRPGEPLALDPLRLGSSA